MTDTEPSAPTPDTPPPATPQSATPQQAPKQQPAVQRLYRTATRGEAVAGMAWLCLGAIIALLWTKNPYLALIPLWVWLGGIILIAFTFSFTGDQLIGSNIRSILLMVAGALGGSWPLFVKK